MEKLLEMKNITKRFPGVTALSGVNLDLEKGEILALLGENGAGKSTLMKILSGAYVPDEGEIYLENEKLEPRNPGEMIEKGIAVMYQELNYLDDLSIAENIFLGNLPIKMGRVNYKKLYADTQELLSIVGLKHDPKTEVSNLSIAEKQMMEIAKVLSKKNKVLVMDEPTSALNEVETQTLFKLLRELVRDGISIVFISHKMDELFEISNRIEVLRDGKYIGTVDTAKTNVNELVTMMVGRTIGDMYPKEEIKHGKTIMSVQDLTGTDVHGVSFEVKEGEIVGLFGLMGSGRTEIVETIFGKHQVLGGSVMVDGKQVLMKNPQDAIEAKIAYVPRERKKDGLVLSASVKENMTYAYLKKMRKGIGLDTSREREMVREWIDRLSIKTPDMETPVDSLSGGNQQKVVIAKWMLDQPRVLILNEPTRGVDVGAKVEIYKMMEDLCKMGIGIVMISSEMPEIMGIADRILVVHEGKIAGECTRNEFSQEKLMFLAIGGE
ncbi:sugar ABC transporter ATP-binding protein [Christensenella tenuis]|jgi:ABC-type sugar transport system ATPase subunit|uniref:Sugar ABC transporter ATP-binding protein n=1 Tax=Christensenella tenuis TaxID=2763033 RepID=A0ABR7ECX4_9FIRM|nr:sugar ABC transporter ATP-binding protein [Christensenella tenuis]MBC5647625.1 sugar ABC transporter ATP-binding protein [Christensenella tenuis]